MKSYFDVHQWNVIQSELYVEVNQRKITKRRTEKREEHQVARTCIRCIGNQPVISCHVSLHLFPGCCKQGSLEFNNRYLSLKDNKALPFNSTKKNM